MATTTQPAGTTTPKRRKQASVHIRRAYDAPADGEGYRVLVDRLWPRGIRKESLVHDAWQRELAPSDALRRWFGHDPARWEEFTERYRHELETDEARLAIEDLAMRALHGPVTLLFGAHDSLHNQAIVLEQEITRAMARLAHAPARRRASSRAERAAPARSARKRAVGRLNS
jgi:uncharacterized protein YeaO (DUF488 family)